MDPVPDLEDTSSAKRPRLDTDRVSQWPTAEYLLRLKTQAGLPQSAIDTVVDATEHLISSVLGQVKASIMQKLDGDRSHLGNVLDECCSKYGGVVRTASQSWEQSTSKKCSSETTFTLWYDNNYLLV